MSNDVFDRAGRCRCCHDGPFPLNADAHCFPCSEMPAKSCRKCPAVGRYSRGLCERCEQRRTVALRRWDGPVPMTDKDF